MRRARGRGYDAFHGARRRAALRLPRSGDARRPPRSIPACCAPVRRKSCSSTTMRKRSRQRTGGSGRRWRLRVDWRWFPTRTARSSSPARAGPRCGRAGVRRCFRRRRSARTIGAETPLPAPRWVMGAPDSLAGAWATLLDDLRSIRSPSTALSSGEPLRGRDVAAGGGRTGDRCVLRLGSGGSDRREGGLAIRRPHSVAGALQDGPGQLPMPHHRGDPQSGVRCGRCARERALGGGAHHGHGGRRGGPARFPPGGSGRRR